MMTKNININIKKTRLLFGAVLSATLVVALVLAPASQTLNALSITSLSQTQGDIAGGDEITLHGTDFIVDKRDEIVELFVGNNHSLALTETGKVFSWGYNKYGQLGNGNNTNQDTPQDITSRFGGEVVTQLYAEGDNTFALTETGKVFSWGYNKYGQLGNGDETSQNVPQDITAGFGGEVVTQLETKGDITFALTKSGKVFSWGYNYYGQLGNGNNTNQDTPQDITSRFGGETVAQLEAEGDITFALTKSGKVFSWGHNYYGQLGNGNNTNQNTPQDITAGFGGEVVAQISAGRQSAFTLTKSNKVFSWGQNDFGQLGNGNNANYNTPQDITAGFGGETVAQISAGSYHSIALAESGKVSSWGNNNSGQLGNGDNTSYNIPQDITAGFGGEVVAQISAGRQSAFTLTKSNKVFSWGNNQYGQLGNGNNANQNTPQDITAGFGGETVAQMSIGGSHSFARTASGKVFSWGYNYFGQLGNGNDINQNTPQDITAGFNFADIPTPQVSSIYFGGSKVEQFEVVDTNTIKLTVPPHTVGKVDVIINDIHSGVTTLAQGYEYVLLPPVVPSEEIEVPNTGY